MPVLHRRSRLRLSAAGILILTLLTAGALLAQDTVTSSQTTGGIPAGPILEQPAATATPELFIENIAATATQIAATIEAAEARVTQAALTAEAILSAAQVAATSTTAAANIPGATVAPTDLLTEIHVQSDAGFSIRYPQGWIIGPQVNVRGPIVLTNSADASGLAGLGQPISLRPGELLIFLTVPAEVDRLYGLGLAADPLQVLQAALDEANLTETTAAPYERLAVPAAIAELPSEFVSTFPFSLGEEGVAITAQYPGIGTTAFVVLSGSPFNQQEDLVIEIVNSVRPLADQSSIVLPTIAVPTGVMPTVVLPTVIFSSEEILATEVAATLMAETIPTVEVTEEAAAPQATPTAAPADTDAAASPLAEILVRADAGFSIRYPEGWIAAPQFEFEEESNLIASSAAATEQDGGIFISISTGDVVILFSIPAELNQFYRLGLSPDPVELLQAAISEAGYTGVDIERYEQLATPAAIAGPLEALAREASPGAFATAITVQYPEIGTLAFIVLSGEPFAQVEPIIVEILASVQPLEAN